MPNLTCRFAASSAIALASAIVLGCAPTSEGDDAELSSQDLTAYDAVVRSGTKIDNDATRNATQSSKTHLIGFIPQRKVDAATSQLLSIGKWTQIKDAQGSQPFTSARPISDRTASGVRTVAAHVELGGTVDIDIACTAKAAADAEVVRVVNTSGYRHWFAGDILLANRLTIDVKLVPYQNGVIVDATARVKLETMEDRAHEMTDALPIVFDWLKKTTPP